MNFTSKRDTQKNHLICPLRGDKKHYFNSPEISRIHVIVIVPTSTPILVENILVLTSCCFFLTSCSADLRSSRVTPWVDRRVSRTRLAWAFRWVSDSSSRTGGTNDLNTHRKTILRLHYFCLLHKAFLKSLALVSAKLHKWTTVKLLQAKLKWWTLKAMHAG